MFLLQNDYKQSLSYLKFYRKVSQNLKTLKLGI